MSLMGFRYNWCENKHLQMGLVPRSLAPVHTVLLRSSFRYAAALSSCSNSASSPLVSLALMPMPILYVCIPR
jgi:hypothetical protein